MNVTTRIALLHGGLIALLFVLNFVLGAYHHGNISRIMVLASYAIGYNILFGYTGLLSLGHALFFAAGMYGMALSSEFLHFAPIWTLVAGMVAALVLSLGLGLLALRTTGVSFMIVTLMFAQAGYLSVLYFGTYTRGDEGFVLDRADRMLMGIDLSQPEPRYLAAWVLFSLCLLTSLWLVRHPFGKTLVAIRENEARAKMLGYDTFAHKLGAMVISGTMSGLAGATYGMFFGYAGASFASVQYSIYPLLWVLLGGAGTVLGPFIGAVFMFYLIDLSSEVTSAYMLIAGVALVLLALFAPQGLVGECRRRGLRWLP